jgi:syntaxin of plants SYP7
MTVIDLLIRVDAICQKYDKYDVDKLNGANVAGDDPFARLYASVDADINQCVEVRPAPPPSRRLSASAAQSPRSESDAVLWSCLAQKAESAKQEKNRATVVALNAEIRRTKAKLLEEDLPKLQRLALKKVTALPALLRFCERC